MWWSGQDTTIDRRVQTLNIVAQCILYAHKMHQTRPDEALSQYVSQTVCLSVCLLVGLVRPKS